MCCKTVAGVYRYLFSLQSPDIVSAATEVISNSSDTWMFRPHSGAVLSALDCICSIISAAKRIGGS